MSFDRQYVQCMSIIRRGLIRCFARLSRIYCHSLVFLQGISVCEWCLLCYRMFCELLVERLSVFCVHASKTGMRPCPIDFQNLYGHGIMQSCRSVVVAHLLAIPKSLTLFLPITNNAVIFAELPGVMVMTRGAAREDEVTKISYINSQVQSSMFNC